MIETIDDLNRFKEECVGDLILHVIPASDNLHPSFTYPIIVFIHCISNRKTYYYAFDHPDSNPNLLENGTGHSFFRFDILEKMSNKKWVLDKKSTCQLLPLSNVYDTNLCGYLKNNNIVDIQEFTTPAHTLVHRNFPNEKKINKIIPLMKHLEVFEDLVDSIKKMIKGFVIDSGYNGMNDIIIPALTEIENNAIFVDRDKFKKRFNIDVGYKECVCSQYNVYTSTGRPSNRFDGVNYAALNHSDGSRECFISRYGKDGSIVVVDYTAFHPRIICMLTKYNIPIDVNIYEYLAKLYFQKQNVDDIDVSEAKKLTFKQLYGGVDEKYSHIKYLANLKTFIDTQWKFFQENGYVLTPMYKRKITDKHITDPSPTKVFNYILQAVEGEVAIPKISEINAYLNSKKTKAILYTYDSIIYDFHKEDGIETLNEIRRIMSYNGIFPMKTYVGHSYQTVKQVSF